jgi:anaerobic selenocysteine-containing dehydrogenase
MHPETDSIDPVGHVSYPEPPRSGASGTDVPEVPSALGLPPVPAPMAPPAGEGLRLVSRRTMWDGGTLIAGHDALGGLAPDVEVRVNPAVLAELGAAEGEKVVVRSGRGSITVPASGDPRLPAGTVVVPWNLPGGRVGELIDSSLAVTTVTIEASGGDD